MMLSYICRVHRI